jgi:hypothetical protein
MQKFLMLFFGVFPFTFFISCASTRAPLIGVLYTSTQSGLAATVQASSKEGEACAISILGVVAVGDASIDTAKRNGRIVSISTIDEKLTSFLGIYNQYCTIVRGK